MPRLYSAKLVFFKIILTAPGEGVNYKIKDLAECR